VTGSSGTRRPAPVGDRRDQLLPRLLRSWGYDAARVVLTAAVAGFGANRSLPIFATLGSIGWPGICGCANVQWVMGAGLFFSGPVHARRAAADGDSGSRSGSSWRTRMEDWLRGRFEGRGE